MKTRIAALAALALLPALLSGCGTSASDDAGAGVGNAYVGASLPASQSSSNQVAVPDVTGQNVSDAKQSLVQLDLIPTEESEDSDPISDETKWQVDGQSPAAGTAVEPGSSVTLKVSKVDKRITLQDIAGQRGDEAEAALEAQGFEVEWDDYIDEPSEWIATETSPKAGSSIDPGSTVTISTMRPPGYTDPAAPSTGDYLGFSDDDSSYDDYSDDGDYLGYDDDYSDDDSYSDDSSDDDYSGYEINNGEGNGYKVTCSDGAISHSGGIQGACSHHGGVAG